MQDMKIELEDDDGQVVVQLTVKTRSEYRAEPLKVARIFERLCDDISVYVERQEQPS
jgi:hypothetical protein